MENNDFIAYEYKTVFVKAKQQAKAMDMYEAFGWEITSTSTTVNGVYISLKRDRKQRHKNELNKLERQAENIAETIDGLEKSKTKGAEIFSYTFGAISALILGGGMSLIMTLSGSIPALVGGIIIGAVGIVLCGINYPIYKKMVTKKIKQVLPAIDENEENLANVLEKGNELLTADII